MPKIYLETQRENDDKILDYIASCNGVAIVEVSEAVGKSHRTTTLAINRLLSMGCISAGAIKKDWIENSTVLAIGYFYESDFPNETESGHFINNKNLSQ